MHDTIFGLIIGEIISILSAGVPSIITYLIHIRNVKEQIKNEYRYRKIK